MEIAENKLRNIIKSSVNKILEAEYYPLPAQQIKNVTGISDDDELNAAIETENEEELESKIWVALKDLANGEKPSKHSYKFGDVCEMLQNKFGLVYSGPDINNEGHEFKNDEITLELFPSMFYEKQGTMNIFNMHVFKSKINIQENKKYMKKNLSKLNESNLHKIVRESINMVLNEGQSDGNPIEKWNYWCANYYPDFIQKAWADKPNMANHLQEKFSAFYDSTGPYGVMLKFYLALDSTNKKILEDYVMNNY